MSSKKVMLTNGDDTATFVCQNDSFRPEWFRSGKRPMLRFKDHEWLNVGQVRVIAGDLLDEDEESLLFGGRVFLAGSPVDWSVRVSLPEDDGPGFTVSTFMAPASEPVEVLEALTTFELPYEYDGSESSMALIAQQPVYQYEAGEEKSGAGFRQPIWYYAPPASAHLTCSSASPLLAYRMANADGSNRRCAMLLGNWDVCMSKDIFAHTSRKLTDKPDELVFPDPELMIKPGLRGAKFLMGALNWRHSSVKDPNWLITPESGLSQEVTVIYSSDLPGGTWDAWAAAGWERLAKINMPEDGLIPAHKVAQSLGASWVKAAHWLANEFASNEQTPFFNPEHGPAVYTPGTRPKWDTGVEVFAGQWTGPLAYLGKTWNDSQMLHSADRLEVLFNQDKSHSGRDVWTIGPTPMFAGVVRKANLVGVKPETMEKIKQYIHERTEFVLNPSPGSRKGDAGILSWDAFANLISADLFDTSARESAARALLVRVNEKLDGRFWTFNCAAEGDLVGAGQARPFGHGIAVAANMLAYNRFGDDQYLHAARRFGNLLLAMHYMPWNESKSPDLDTRGWAQGSTGGRDQIAQMPPWETGYGLQQFAPLIMAGAAREGFYDVLWFFSHTGLCQFPAARTLKRLYTTDLQITYRDIHSLPTEREFYLKLPYACYENPWDQTMLACYQSVEPIVLSMMLGGALVEACDDRVLALVPEAGVYAPNLDKGFDVHLWNPTQGAIATTLNATIAVKRGESYSVSGAWNGLVSPENSITGLIEVPSRQVVKVHFAVK